MKQLARLVQKITPPIKEMRQNMVLLDLPQNDRSEEFLTLIIGNTRRFKLFLEKLVNPVSICKLINEYGYVTTEHIP